MRPFKEDKSLVYGLCNTNRRKYYWKALHKRRGSLRRKQCRAIFKNTIWPEMPFKTHRLIPATGEKEIEVLLEIPLRQYAVTATAPGLHLPLETITEDLRNFGLVQISNQQLERSRKRSHNTTVKYKGKYRKYKKARDVTQCISRFSPAFRPLSCTPPCSLGTALTGVGVVASMTPGGIAGVCAVIFFVSAASSKKLKTNDSKHKIIYSPLRHQSMKAWRDPSQKLSVTAHVTDDEFCNGSEPRLERRIRRKLRKATKVVEQPHVEQRELENLRRNGLILFSEPFRAPFPKLYSLITGHKAQIS